MNTGRNPSGRTIFDKIWSAHRIADRPDGQTLLYVDRHFIHDGYAPAFEMLAGARPQPRGVRTAPSRRPTTTCRPTAARSPTIADPERREMVESLVRNTAKTGIQLFGLDDRRQGIVHVIGPEQGMSQPGMIIVCGDSHTSTHGALGALAFGIGMTEASYVLASQTLWQRQPKTMRITVDGGLGHGRHREGHDPAHHRPDRRGRRHRPRHRICRAGDPRPVDGRPPHASATCRSRRARGPAWSRLTRRPSPTSPAGPSRRKGADWDRAWRAGGRCPPTPDAAFDREVDDRRRARSRPMVTWGTSPQDVSPSMAACPIPPARRRRAPASIAPGARLHGPDAGHAR